MTKAVRPLMVIDDDLDMHQGLRMMLDQYEIRSFYSGEDALGMADQENFPVILLDLHLGDVSGIEILQQLKWEAPWRQIIILTGMADKENAISALNFDAFRYVTKPFDVLGLQKILDQAFERFEQEFLFPSNREGCVNRLRKLGLTRREAEMSMLAVRGQTNTEIADEIKISQRTVEKHFQNIFQTLKIQSRSKIVQQISQRFH